MGPQVTRVPGGMTMRACNRGALVALLAAMVITAIAGTAPVAQADCLPPPSGLVSWYAGDGNPYDLVGANHALAHGALVYVPGVVGTAFGFDGTSAYLDVLDSDDLDFSPTENFTIAGWMLFHAGSAPTQFIIDKRQLIGPSAARGYALVLMNGRIMFQMNDDSGSTNFTGGGPDLRDDVFHFVAVTIERQSPTGGSIRVDGAEVLNFDPTVRPGDLSNASSLRIGRYIFDSVASYFLSGDVDELDFYSRALTANELDALRAAVPLGKCRPAFFFGEDVNQTDLPPSPPDDPTRPAELPNCRVAQSAFLSALGTARYTNGFEELAPNSSVSTLAFGPATATVVGGLFVRDVPTGTFDGTYPTEGNRFGLQFGNGTSFTLAFSSPQRALGFMGTDIGDGGTQLLLTFHRVDGTSVNIATPNSVGTPSAFPNISGSALFFGTLDPDHPFTSVTFTNPRASLDGFGFDEIVVQPANGTSDVAVIPVRAGVLRQNAPNPFNPRTTIAFDLPSSSHVTVAIFDVAGRRVCTLVDELRSAGRHSVVWNGTDDEGRLLSSGVYFCRMATGSFRESRRMTLLK